MSLRWWVHNRALVPRPSATRLGSLIPAGARPLHRWELEREWRKEVTDGSLAVPPASRARSRACTLHSWPHRTIRWRLRRFGFARTAPDPPICHGLARHRLADRVETVLSIRNYQRTNGEVIALLVVAPFKSDRERIIPMSAELFHPIAQAIKATVAGTAPFPSPTATTPDERVWKASLPYLFQRLNGLHRSAVTPTTIRRRLQMCCAELAQVHPEFDGVTFARTTSAAVRHRAGQHRTPHPHRRRSARSPQHRDHPRLGCRLRRGGRASPPAVFRPSARPTAG